MELRPRTTKGARVERTLTGWRLSIPAGDAGRYRLAQLDNCTGLARKDFPYRTLDLRLRARVSSTSVPGTWGFGAWNDPYRLSLGRGENPFQVLALPNAAWFFFSSKESYLSFCDDKPGNGFLAQTFNSPAMPLGALLGAAGTFPFSRVAARRRLSRLIREEAAVLGLDVTKWHAYRMRWDTERVTFEVDGTCVLETEASPRPPLGVVIWIDNQFAAFTPQGKVAFGTLENPAGLLELEALELNE